MTFGPGRAFLLGHVYASPGTYTVTVEVVDQDGSPGTKSISVPVADPIVIPPPTNPVASDPTALSGFGPDRDAFVRTIYREQLGREPEPDGLRFWSGRLASGDRLLSVASAIRGSSERRALQGRGLAPQVNLARAYADALRAARQASLAATITPPQSSVLPSASGFGPDRDAFVRTIYREQLGRDPEADGLRFWSGRLASGEGTRTVASAIRGSSERRALQSRSLAPRVGADRAYADALNAARRAVHRATALALGPADRTR